MRLNGRPAAPCAPRLSNVFQWGPMTQFNVPNPSQDPTTVGWAPTQVDAQAFASIVRHDLVNPLNALSGWLHLLAMRPAPAEDIVQRALSGARRALDQQLQQIDLLNRLMQLSQPTIAMLKGSTDPGELMEALTQPEPGSVQVSFKGPSPDMPSLMPAVRVAGQKASLTALFKTLIEFVRRQGESGAECVIAVQTADGGVQWLFRVSPARPDPDPWPQPSATVSGADAHARLSIEWLHAQTLVHVLGGRIESPTPDPADAVLSLWLPEAVSDLT